MSMYGEGHVGPLILVLFLINISYCYLSHNVKVSGESVSSDVKAIEELLKTLES